MDNHAATIDIGDVLLPSLWGKLLLNVKPWLSRAAFCRSHQFKLPFGVIVLVHLHPVIVSTQIPDMKVVEGLTTFQDV
jgi:hypothetical protein